MGASKFYLVRLEFWYAWNTKLGECQTESLSLALAVMAG
jgi:hypothetical protein